MLEEGGTDGVISGGCIPNSLEKSQILRSNQTQLSQEEMQPAEMQVLIHTARVSVVVSVECRSLHLLCCGGVAEHHDQLLSEWRSLRGGFSVTRAGRDRH